MEHWELSLQRSREASLNLFDQETMMVIEQRNQQDFCELQFGVK